jgi:hypothetical protein
VTDSFTYRRTIEEHCFLQRPLLDLRQFVLAAEARDLPRFDAAALEGLDRERFLMPLAYRIGGAVTWGSEAQLLADGRLLLREEREFMPWRALQEEHGSGPRGEPVVPLYSFWSLLTLWELWRLLQVRTAAPFLPEGLDAWLSERQTAASWVDRERLADTARGGLHRDLLLIRTQSILVPRITGVYVTTHHPTLGDTADYTFALEQSFDWNQAARECGADAEALEATYRATALQGGFIDPLAAWWLLVDQASRRAKERLRGSARVALDYYDAARVVRGWHFNLTGQRLPDIDELTDPERARAVKERDFGSADTRNNRRALVGLLDYYGLYPWRVQLIVEGPSETKLLAELLELAFGHSFDSLGILVVEFGGAGIPKKAEEFLGRVRAYANYYLLVFDNEGKAAKFADELKRRGIITDDEAHLWTSDLEADNFTVGELCDVAEGHIRQQDGMAGFQLDREEVGSRIANPKNPSEPPGVLTVIQKVAEGHAARFDKDDVAVDLARHAHSQPKHPDTGDDRRLFELLETLVNAAEADRRPPQT